MALTFLSMKSALALAMAFAVAPANATQAPQIGRFGFDTTGMDRAVRPATDFYGYANGTWDRTTPIPPDKSNVGQFTRLADINTGRLREILDAERKHSGSLAGAAYASYLDESRVEARAMAAFDPMLSRVRGIQTREDFAVAAAEAARDGVAFPVDVAVEPDNGAPDHYIAVVSPSVLGMPDRSYYLDDAPSMREARGAYVGQMEQVLGLLGEVDVHRRAAAVMSFETAVAKASWAPSRMRDAKATYNPMTADALARSTVGFDVRQWLHRLGSDADRVVVSQPDALSAVTRLVAGTPLDVLRDALLLREFHAFAPFLPRKAYDIDFAFYGKVIQGNEQPEPRETRAVAFAVSAVPDEVSRPYVARYFTPATKASAVAMVKEIVAAMNRRLGQLAWMTPATQAKAKAKLAAFTPKIGYPDRWHDYSGLAMKADDLFGNAQRAQRWQRQWEIAKIGKPLYRWEWSSTPMTVDAFANYPTIEITFPAAILQPPFFDPHADPAINYGGIGAVIGHELSHQFDDQGARYDETGRLATWWTPADVAAFDARTAQLVAQYAAYEPLPGMPVDGRLTLGENLADLAGLTVAYDAYRQSLHGSEAPMIDGFSGDQRFFLGWAQMWRLKYRDADMRRRLLTNPHAPADRRVWTMRNIDAWYPAYGAHAGDAMYLAPADRVRVW